MGPRHDLSSKMFNSFFFSFLISRMVNMEILRSQNLKTHIE